MSGWDAPTGSWDSREESEEFGGSDQRETTGGYRTARGAEGRSRPGRRGLPGYDQAESYDQPPSYDQSYDQSAGYDPTSGYGPQAGYGQQPDSGPGNYAPTTGSQAGGGQATVGQRPVFAGNSSGQVVRY